MADDTKLRILIADDEPAARARLGDLLAETADVEVVGLATNGREAVDAIRRLAPDLVFLDVQMPVLTGTDVVHEIGPANMPAVVFVTAYDEYAVKAFELAALDYLLKPFDDERFEDAMRRVRQTIELRDIRKLQNRLATLLQQTQTEAPPSASAPRYLERIAVDMRGQLRIVPVDRIDFITASGSYAELHVGKDTFLIREQMQTLEERLDPSLFFRIHRSTIIRLDQVEALLYNAGGDYAVRLKDGRRLKVSRSRYEDLQQQLGIASS